MDGGLLGGPRKSFLTNVRAGFEMTGQKHAFVIPNPVLKLVRDLCGMAKALPCKRTAVGTDVGAGITRPPPGVCHMPFPVVFSTLQAVRGPTPASTIRLPLRRIAREKKNPKIFQKNGRKLLTSHAFFGTLTKRLRGKAGRIMR